MRNFVLMLHGLFRHCIYFAVRHHQSHLQMMPYERIFLRSRNMPSCHFCGSHKKKTLLIVAVAVSLNVLIFVSIVPGRRSQVKDIHRPQQRQEAKVLVYHCSHGDFCGGLGDRQKGIVGGFVLSAMLNRTFKIHMPFQAACDLEALLTPSEYDWRIRGTELAHPDLQTVMAMDIENLFIIHDLLRNEKLEKSLPYTYTLFRTNMEIVQFLLEHPAAKRVDWMKNKTVPDIYRDVLNTLFSPSERIQKRLQAVESEFRAQNKSLVCAQVRLGQSETFQDSQQFLDMQVFPVLETFLTSFNDSQKFRIFFASDSSKIIDLARASFPTVSVTIPGPITHVDKTRGGEACEGAEKAVLEQLVLATCDVLVISESGFAKVAAFMRGRDENLYIVYRKKGIIWDKVVLEPYRRDALAFPNRNW